MVAVNNYAMIKQRGHWPLLGRSLAVCDVCLGVAVEGGEGSYKLRRG